MTSTAGRALAGRTEALLRVLGCAASGIAPPQLIDALGRCLATAERAEWWLALTTLSAAFPEPSAVSRLQRCAALDGPVDALDRLCLGPILAGGGQRNGDGSLPTVRVVTGAVIVDVNDTSRSLFATGIQRVARETVRRWDRDHDVVLVGWDPALPALRALTAGERDCALHGADEAPARPAAAEVLVPWRCTHVLPELLAESDRVASFHGYVRDSGNRVAVIGYDCVPLTTAETTQHSSLNEGFAMSLAALAHARCIAPISEASAVEFSGWRAMLGGAGLGGPDIRVVGLPAEARDVSAEVVERVRASYVVADMPLVLVVGSHEPRKNHLVVLHAAERLWRAGLVFSVTFVGGNAWSSEMFRDRLRELAAAGRAVSSVSAAPDEELWAAYRLARFTVFPSLNEGFGLPLAESLSVGTPAVTSDFGSMREIAAAGGGAVLVDPRDASSVAEGMRRLLTDDALLGGLVAECAGRAVRTWDDYATELWDVLVDGAE